ncbi:MAG TPA: DUF4350 domain-containing protein [Gemmatimonadales bacterium]|nr:DUF4350 domain-containing protein [Gemmatimonadales bacterium]
MSVRAEIGLALLLALGITVAMVVGKKSGAPAAVYEPASTFASGPSGSRGPYEVLQELGVKVERRRIPLFDLNSETDHHPRILIILDLEQPGLPLESSEIKQVAQFVQSGGMLVLAGFTGGIARCLPWAIRSQTSYRPDSFPVAPVAGRDLPDVTNFFQPRRDSVAPGEGTHCPVFGVATTDTVVRTQSGRPVVLDLRYRDGGRIVFLADDGWFRNTAWKTTNVPYVLAPMIQSAARDRLVAFDEYHHGFSSSSAPALTIVWLMGTPVGWFLLQILLVGLVWLVVSAFRFGPALPVIDRRRRSPLEHLDALAAGLESSEGSQTALGLIVGGLRRRLSRTGEGPAAKANEQWIAALMLAMPTAQGRGAVRRLREAFTKPGGGERVLAAANSVEDVWEELRPRTTRDAFSKP